MDDGATNTHAPGFARLTERAGIFSEADGLETWNASSPTAALAAYRSGELSGFQLGRVLRSDGTVPVAMAFGSERVVRGVVSESRDGKTDVPQAAAFLQKDVTIILHPERT